VAVWFAIGVAVAGYLYRKRRESLDALSFEGVDQAEVSPRHVANTDDVR
jgi:hypothetical protein